MADTDVEQAAGRVTGAIQDLLDAKYGKGHIVTEWVVLAHEIDPDGKRTCYTYVSDECDRIVAYGLASMAEDEVRSVFGDEEEED